MPNLLVHTAEHFNNEDEYIGFFKRLQKAVGRNVTLYYTGTRTVEWLAKEGWKFRYEHDYPWLMVTPPVRDTGYGPRLNLTWTSSRYDGDIITPQELLKRVRNGAGRNKLLLLE